ncbi:MAG: mannitol dehydrogenase family protein [Sporomusaceae bacterium]|nr:mannitol dehydrogenase family protein [Sporomusaceae bacterium]
MLHLRRAALSDKESWQQAGIETIAFDDAKMRTNTKERPNWVHFGGGNIFRAFLAAIHQELLNDGKVDTGIVAVSTYDLEIIEKVYEPYENLSLLAVMHADGSLDKKVIASVAEGLLGDSSRPTDWQRLCEIFQNPSLQMVSFTITEKGYQLTDLSGSYLSEVLQDMQNGPKAPVHVMAKVAALALARYKQGELPLAFVSMDNCSHNGDKLAEAVLTFAQAWEKQGFVPSQFVTYLQNRQKVAFPWTMIDKITPRPSEIVQKKLHDCGFGDTELIRTKKNTFIAPFVNAEGPQYLVIEDHFPNGRMPLEDVGVLFTDRQTVEKVEKMKVTTCLNPLHTALAVFGCLLGYTLIADEMKDPELKQLVEKIGYDEGMPVVVDPEILKPLSFIQEVLEVRLPNPYIPDTPQRIATDTSQKVGVRFGETIKAYQKSDSLRPEDLRFIPLAIAGWCRYLLAIDDQGKPFELSPDPLAEKLTAYLQQVKLGDTDCLKIHEALAPILSNEDLFGINLYEAGLGNKIEEYFAAMIEGSGAVRKTLQQELAK